MTKALNVGVSANALLVSTSVVAHNRDAKAYQVSIPCIHIWYKAATPILSISYSGMDIPVYK
jgi:hypothetical protein